MNIWRKEIGEKYITTIGVELERLVENQSFITTRQLVDSGEEQKILEEEIENSKPPCQKENARGVLHYLLFTPFRYPPLKDGARFHRRDEQSIFYGALELTTAMAEIAYKRFVFRACSKAKFLPMSIDYTKFTTSINSKKGIDLTSSPFDKHTDLISNPLSHVDTQILGTEMRKAGVEVFIFNSARTKGKNGGVISVEAFSNNNPQNMESWSVFDSEDVMEFRCKTPMKGSKATIFKLDDFLVGGVFPVFS